VVAVVVEDVLLLEHRVDLQLRILPAIPVPVQEEILYHIRPVAQV
jgi:hypothetical protein